MSEPRGYIDDVEASGAARFRRDPAEGDALDLSPVVFDRRLFSDDLIRDLGGDPEAQGLS